MTSDTLTDHVREIEYLPDLIGWNIRTPTREECELVGRDVSYAEAVPTDRGDTDNVIEIGAGPESQAAFARAFETFDWCDVAHVVPAGVYVEGARVPA